ncbi:23 kDa jasmonate-induced protein-like [Typha latifolia]|uniref:23 kDa jasmonate-induced protein-like n=1 Tax=Typha latifolia TaxID=4733 RepID=UPI003C2CE545
MAYNAFGIPVTTETLERMSEYVGKTITHKDRAKVALDMKNAESKDVNAHQFVEQLKERYGNGVATLCLIYNATGDPLTYITSHDYFDHILYSPYAYTEIREPNHFDNTVWGVISDKMEKSGIHCEDVWNGCWSGVSIRDDTTTVYEGIMTLQDVAKFAP